MSVILKVLAQNQAINNMETYISVTTSGNYVTGVGGDSCSLAASNIKDPNLIAPMLPSQMPPIPPSVDNVELGGYWVELTPGATLSAGKLKWFQPSGAELGSGAYPAGIVTLKMVAPKGL